VLRFKGKEKVAEKQASGEHIAFQWAHQTSSQKPPLTSNLPEQRQLDVGGKRTLTHASPDPTKSP
jgi:hypothetical protein